MASIFTYDPDPPRVSSPWLNSEDKTSPNPNSNRRSGTQVCGSSLVTPPPGVLTEYNVTKLGPEPQTTSTEYKLHLLLRPRRAYSSSSTGTHIAGSQQSNHPSSHSGSPRVAPAVPAPSNQSRQNRLHQLTTQLLWRLQQSSPYHASAASDLVLPQLPEDRPSPDAPFRHAKLLPGLAESRGALYEIGVSDDGTFVGLTEDEMQESLTNLRAMASSLGCTVEVIRRVIVGNCEWEQNIEEESSDESSKDELREAVQVANARTKVLRHKAQLWVAEALVTPHLLPENEFETPGAAKSTQTISGSDIVGNLPHSNSDLVSQTTDQLRITLTGPTTSGKSSLLGTLSTATLDNGRGKSRLSLLKHRHELASGLTSSVAQELIGYNTSSARGVALNVVNFATGNVTSWTDIHASSKGCRLIFVSDSAGHPRYRRTTVRGLVGWAPDWTMLCIAADDDENAPSGAGGTSSAREILGVAGTGVDLAKAHLDLCLKLEKPLAIIITKLDLASRTSLRQTLAKILTAIKATGRIPAMLPPDQSKDIIGSDLEAIPQSDKSTVEKIVETMAKSDLNRVVPIIMTSAARGTGIRMLHALLHTLPIPVAPTSSDFVGPALNPEQPACIFHIEDVFGMPAAYSTATKNADSGIVVGGYLRFGTISIGDTVVIGPFPTDSASAWDSPGADKDETQSPSARSDKRPSPARYANESSNFGSFAASHPSASELTRMTSKAAVPASVVAGEWHNARIVSLRNLRLPAHRLESGQVGTIGIVIDLPNEEISNGPFERQPQPTPRVRKGMVLAIPSRHMVQTGLSLQAASGFTASFEDGDVNSITLGSLVVIYIASIRAPARVVRLAPQVPVTHVRHKDTDDIDEIFSLDDAVGMDTESESPVFGTDGVTDVTLELLNNREWIELGSQVLIMPGGGHGLYSGTERGEKGIAGLEGFVGKVTEVVD